MKKVLGIIAIVVITAVITATATGFYMVKTAEPDRPCSISWNGQIYDYEYAVAVLCIAV